MSSTVLKEIEAMKTTLMTAISNEIHRKGWTQREAAKRLGCSQPRVSTLVNQKSNAFSIDYLSEIFIRLGGNIDLQIKI